MNINEMQDYLCSYLTTALWSSTGDNDEPLDDHFSITDIEDSEVIKALFDCNAFMNKAGDLLNGLESNKVMHDFWLTRNGHGAGFWDGKYHKKLADSLTKLSEEFGECNLSVGDDGKLYFS